MPQLDFILKSGIYALMAICVGGALLSVFFRNLFHAALALTGTLFGIAGIYLALHADFLAMIQILIYVGAIMTLVVFAIMLTERLSDSDIRAHNSQGLAVCVCGLFFISFLASLIHTTPWPLQNHSPAAPVINAVALGQALLGTYVFPFEIISIILIGALVGAIVVARKDSNS